MSVALNPANDIFIEGEPPATVKTVSILIAGDDAFSRHSQRLLIAKQPGWTVVAETAGGKETVACAIALEPDIAVLGGLDGMEGLAATRLILASVPNMKVLLLAGDRRQATIEKAVATGVLGYVPERHAGTEIIPAINALLQGRVFFTTLRSPAPDLRKRPALSPREITIVEFVAAGRRNREVASILGISTRTVENHRAKIMKKLGLRTVCALVRYAIKEGMVEP
jgi:DNA-binding NarL/FixJ family response regulator